MSKPVVRRLQTEIRDLTLNGSEGISAFPMQDQLTHWTASIDGPEDTPYQGLKLRLFIQFPHNYPYAPPKVVFISRIYHPNVDMSGRICLDILKDKWSPAYSIRSLLISLCSLLGEPNNDSPLNAEAARLWDSDQELFKRNVLQAHNEMTDQEADDGVQAILMNKIL